MSSSEDASRADDAIGDDATGDDLTTGEDATGDVLPRGAVMACGELRTCDGMVATVRARSNLACSESASAASLRTTAGVEGSSLGTYGFAGVVRPCATEPGSGELEGGGGTGAGGGGGRGVGGRGGTGAGAAVVGTGAATGIEGATVTDGDDSSRGGEGAGIEAGAGAVLFGKAGAGAALFGGEAGPTTIGAIPTRVCFGWALTVVGAAGREASSDVGRRTVDRNGARGAVRGSEPGGLAASGSDSSHDAVKRSDRRSASASLSGEPEGRSGSGIARCSCSQASIGTRASATQPAEKTHSLGSARRGAAGAGLRPTYP